MIRADKTTKNRDDMKVVITGILLCISILIFSSLVHPKLTEKRWYRDMMSLTPFHNVELFYTTISEDGHQIIFGGSLIKRRCQFNDLVGYVTDQYDLRHRVPINTKIEDERGVKGSRPPSKNAELWGPWSIDISGITVFNEHLIPQSIEVIAFHVECSTTPKSQSNLFLSTPWENFSLDINDN